MKSICHQISVVALVAACLGTTAKRENYAQYVHDDVTAALDQLQQNSDYGAVVQTLQSLFDQTTLYGPNDHVEGLREADFALRLVTQLQQVEPAARDELLPFLRAHDGLAHTFVFLIHGEKENPAKVYALLEKLRESRGEQLDTFATLAAALCVVHDRPLSRHINENEVDSVDPIEIFDYYVKNENRMFFGMRNVPAELLIYVVDTTASVKDMNWALKKYAGNSNVGKLFFDIDYDYGYLKRGTDKTVTVKGYTLPNILKYGGVCADQAYFATTVGKAIGVPTAYDTGISAEAAHAWVGFLQSSGQTAFWNFNSGRYESFQGVRGTVLDPQTRQNIPDSYVSLLGEMIGTKAVDRQNAVALTDAATRLSEIQVDAVTAPPVEVVMPSSFLTKPRATDVAAQLGLIELALRQSVAYAPAWFTIRNLAIDKKLAFADKQRWSDLLLRLGAKKYPDFTLEILLPMVKSIDDPQEQDLLLTRLLPLFATRLDLSAAILMSEASLWESQHQTNRAGQCYMNVVERYTNGGPFVLAALTGAETLLKDSNRADQVVLLYQQAWSKTQKPPQMAAEFMAESNWFQIGVRYAQKLAEAGDISGAGEVASKLGITIKAADR